jgi:hypothetical protein
VSQAQPSGGWASSLGLEIFWQPEKLLRWRYGAENGNYEDWRHSTKFNVIVNLQTAKALGIALPTSIRVRADEVIE